MRSYVLLSLCAAVVLCATTYEKKNKEVLDGAGDKTLIDIYRELDEDVATMDSASQAEHKTWKATTDKEIKARDTQMKKAMDGLSPEGQAKLVRTIMVQQNHFMTLNEKRDLLWRIQHDMDTDVREELVAKVPEDVLFKLVV